MTELMEAWDGEVDINENLQDLVDHVDSELNELACGRTPFQLVHFVVGAHGTIEEGAGPAMRMSALNELEVALRNIARYRISLERARRKRKSFVNSTDADADLDIMECDLEIKGLKFDLRKKMREVKVLREILNKLPSYTWKEMQALEPKRWTHRLLRQSEEYHQALKTGLPQGEVMSMVQASNDEILPGVGKMTEDLIAERIEFKEKTQRLTAEAKLLI